MYALDNLGLTDWPAIRQIGQRFMQRLASPRHQFSLGCAAIYFATVSLKTSFFHKVSCKSIKWRASQLVLIYHDNLASYKRFDKVYVHVKFDIV